MSRCTFLTVIHRHFITSFIPRVIPLRPSLSCVACSEVFCVPFPPGGCWGRTPVVAMNVAASNEHADFTGVHEAGCCSGGSSSSRACSLVECCVFARGKHSRRRSQDVPGGLLGGGGALSSEPTLPGIVTLLAPVCAVDAPLPITPSSLSVVCHGFAEACYFVPTVRRRPRRPDRWALEPLAS